MPELPEVEVVKRGLSPLLIGKTITAVEYSGKPLRTAVPFDKMTRTLPGRQVTDIRRRAKFLIIAFDNGMQQIIHLGMTGKLGIYTSGDTITPP